MRFRVPFPRSRGRKLYRADALNCCPRNRSLPRKRIASRTAVVGRASEGDEVESGAVHARVALECNAGDEFGLARFRAPCTFVLCQFAGPFQLDKRTCRADPPGEDPRGTQERRPAALNSVRSNAHRGGLRFRVVRRPRVACVVAVRALRDVADRISEGAVIADRGCPDPEVVVVDRHRSRRHAGARRTRRSGNRDRRPGCGIVVRRRNLQRRRALRRGEALVDRCSGPA